MVTPDGKGGVVSRPALDRLGVDHPQEWVIGMPAHVAIEVRAATREASFRRLPLPTLLALNDAVGIELANRSGQPVLALEPHALEGASQEGPTFDLGFGATRRMLLDISELLGELPSGAYNARMSYGTRTNRARSDPFAITLRQPSQDERLVFDALLAERTRAGSWGEWTYRRRPDGAPWLFLPAKDPLRYHLVLNQLLFGPQDLNEVDPVVLAEVDAVTNPEAAALRAELLGASGNTPEFERQVELVRSQWPGLTWWIDRIAEGRSEIAFLRRATRKEPG